MFGLYQRLCSGRRSGEGGEVMEKYQAYYLFGIAVGWMAHRYFDISGRVVTFAIVLSVLFSWLLNTLWP